MNKTTHTDTKNTVTLSERTTEVITKVIDNLDRIATALENIHPQTFNHCNHVVVNSPGAIAGSDNEAHDTNSAIRADGAENNISDSGEIDPKNAGELQHPNWNNNVPGIIKE